MLAITRLSGERSAYPLSWKLRGRQDDPDQRTCRPISTLISSVHKSGNCINEGCMACVRSVNSNITQYYQSYLRSRNPLLSTRFWLSAMVIVTTSPPTLFPPTLTAEVLQMTTWHLRLTENGWYTVPHAESESSPDLHDSHHPLRSPTLEDPGRGLSSNAVLVLSPMAMPPKEPPSSILGGSPSKHNDTGL